MRVRMLLCVGLLFLAHSASAFIPWMWMGAIWLTEYVGIPVSYALGCAFAYSPPIRVVGTQKNVYGLDWGSLACHAENVYGLQMSFCGGSFERDLYGLQLGILASGYAQRELLFDDYHIFNIDNCRLNGLQFGTFAAKTSVANGVQTSAVYADARMVNGLQLAGVFADAQAVNGFQIATVNAVGTLHGLQIGLWNSARRGLGVQIGLVNLTESGLLDFSPILNCVF